MNGFLAEQGNSDISQIYSISNFDEYLSYVKTIRNDYLIILAVKDTPGSNLTDKQVKAIHDVGFSDFTSEVWISYVGIIYKGRVVVDLNGGVFDNTISIELPMIGLHRVSVVSSPWRDENRCSIVIDGTEYALNNRGINLVVFDTSRSKLVDRIGFDFHGSNPVFIRNERDASTRDFHRSIASINFYHTRIVRFLYWTNRAYFYNTIETVIEAFNSSEIYEVSVVLLEKNAELEKIFSVQGISYCSYEEWVKQEEEVDIFFVQSVLSIIRERGLIEKLATIRKRSKLVIFQNTFLIFNLFDDAFWIERGIKALERIGVDYFMSDKLFMCKCKDENISNPIMIEMGNPKYDSIFLKLQKDSNYPNDWDKLRGKKTFLWLIDHDIDTYTNVSLDLYLKDMFQFFFENEEAALIFRPHPLFEWELVHKYKILSKTDMRRFKAFIKSSKSIVWDDDPSYANAYKISDAMMMELGSGVTASALATQKPICILFRNDRDVKIHHPELINAYYKCYSKKDLYDFLNMIKRGEDPKRDERAYVAKKYIAHFDGKNGQRVYDFINKEYEKRYTND